MLELIDLHHRFHQADQELHILRGVNLEVMAGEMVALVAPSGTGKSTLLQLAGLLDQLQSGTIRIDGQDVGGVTDQQRSTLRAQKIGFVYQFHYLLPEFSALENIIMPQLIAGQTESAAQARAMNLLTQIGLADRAHHRPGQLSGGEQQRVAILRALANQPKILLADEPTGNLDADNARLVWQLLRDLAKAQNMAVIIATHNRELAQTLDRVVTLRDGQVVLAG